MDQDKQRAWIDTLYRPLPGQNPDNVNQRVIDDEMSAFGAFQQEVK